mmetsp:Transcript_19579/g.42486  ORF Transcript_19579/g.42486 Transcript_19579/m.42486 type:complete len:153 (-) Transcript_19579:61-519(-)
MEMLLWLQAHQYPLHFWDEGTCSEAAGEGQLEVLKWLRAQDPPCPWSPDYYESDSEYESEYESVSSSGFVSEIDWEHDHESIYLREQEEGPCCAAAENGQLEALQWLLAEGCPWFATACDAAARNGHLAVLQWLRAKGCPWDKRQCSASSQH